MAAASMWSVWTSVPAGCERIRGRGLVQTLRRRLRSEHGQAMVEFALVLPLLVVLVFGMIDFGRGINYWLDVNHLASEGARIASVDNPKKLDLVTYLRDQATTGELRDGGSSSVSGPLQVCVDLSGGDGHVGDPVTLKVWTRYHWLPLPRLLGGGSWADTDIVGSATMRLEAPADVIRTVPGCVS